MLLMIFYSFSDSNFKLHFDFQGLFAKPLLLIYSYQFHYHQDIIFIEWNLFQQILLVILKYFL